MKRFSRISTAVVALVALISVPAFAAKTQFNAHLSGQNAVPARATTATGQAKFTLSTDLQSMQYKITVGNIENVVAVRLENAATGATGPEVAVLFGPVAPGGGKQSGVISTGLLTSAKLVGPMAGKSIADLVAAIEAGQIYVNILTDDGVGAPDERPGDFSTGEIRGQVE